MHVDIKRLRKQIRISIIPRAMRIVGSVVKGLLRPGMYAYYAQLESKYESMAATVAPASSANYLPFNVH